MMSRAGFRLRPSVQKDIGCVQHADHNSITIDPAWLHDNRFAKTFDAFRTHDRFAADHFAQQKRLIAGSINNLC